MSQVAPARRVAGEVLLRVMNDGAYASVALNDAIERAHLSAEDAGLAVDLVYGVLRHQATLDAALAGASSRGKLKVKPAVHVWLLIGGYEILIAERTPGYAAVSQAVQGVRGERPEMAGLANALLRRLTEAPRPEKHTLARGLLPAWVQNRLLALVPEAEAQRFAECMLAPAPTSICVFDPRLRDEWGKQLSEAAPGGAVTLGRLSPHAILLERCGDPRRLPGFGDAWMVQEEGAQLLALALGAKAGERVLDACAGHGNKTRLLAARLGTRDAVEAVDVHAKKLSQLSGFVTHVHDWTTGPWRGPLFDRILVDAPCLGLGTLRRRPEILHRTTESDVARMADLQRRIVLGALTALRPGGTLVYSVCSFTREECEGVLEAVIGEAAGVVPVDLPWSWDGAQSSTRSGVRLWPHVHGTDAYFCAALQKN